MRWLIVLSVIFALLLSVVPVPFEWRVWRPEFVALVVIYWAVYSPEYFGIFFAWCCGLLYDLVELSPLGFNALGLVVVTYIAHSTYQRIRNYSVWQQSFWALVLVGIYQLLCSLISNILDVESPPFLMVGLISACLWPPFVVIMQGLRSRLHLL